MEVSPRLGGDGKRQLAPEELEELHQIFKMWDEDASGSLEPEEIKRVLPYDCGIEPHELARILADADQNLNGASIFGYHVADPSNYGVVDFDDSGIAVSLEEKPLHPKSNYAVPGLYFYDGNASSFANQLKPSERGELEITDLNRIYLEAGKLSVEVLGRGTAWLDTGSHENLASATDFIKIIERRQGLKIACLEEIAYSKSWLDSSGLRSAIDAHGSSSYGEYLRTLFDRD